MNDFIPCRDCASSDTTPGYKRTQVTYGGEEYEVLEKCECLSTWQHNRLLLKKVQQAGLRPSLVDTATPYSPSTDYKGTESLVSVRKLQRYVASIDQPPFAGSSVYMYGAYNTQKTTLAQWAAVQLIKQGKSVQYVLMRTLLNALVDEQHSYSDVDEAEGRERRKLLKRVHEADVLIVDEAFDKQKMTMYKSGYQLPFLDEFLRNKIDMKEQPVIFVSNVAIDSIDEQFSSLRNLLHRRIKMRGAELHFQDDFTRVANEFDVADIFA